MTMTPTTDRFANHCGYSDVEPFEITRVVGKMGKCIEVRAMKYERDESVKLDFHVGGFSAHCSNQNEQKWIITPNPDGYVMKAYLRKDGYFHSAWGRHAIADEPRRHYDYNF